MNSGVNALGQGNRANATIGRAVQLVVRNVGGGKPGGVKQGGANGKRRGQRRHHGIAGARDIGDLARA